MDVAGEIMNERILIEQNQTITSVLFLSLPCIRNIDIEVDIFVSFFIKEKQYASVIMIVRRCLQLDAYQK